jgi:hypothetical protein
MKIANKYFKGLSLLSLMTLLVFSCEEFKEFDSTSFGPGPIITLSLVSLQDSSFTVSVTSDADGYASVILLPGTGNDIPDPENLLTGNIQSLDYQSKKGEANQAINFTFEGLFQWSLYEVQSAANNPDGKVSEVSSLTVGTDDSHGPILTATDPGVTYDPVLMIGGPVTLVFDEWVEYDETKPLIFTEFYDGEDVNAGSVVVDGNIVTVTPGEGFTYHDYIWLSYPEGAFTDYAGNPTAEVETYFDADAGAFVGLYWRVEAHLYEALSVTPEAGIVPPSRFDIVVTFDAEVDASAVADGDMTLTYDDGLDFLTKGVLASDIIALDNTLTIKQSSTPMPGMTVTLNIPEGALEIGYRNPNAEVSTSWIIEHPLGVWMGNYSVAAVSYGDPGEWDEAWAASIGPATGYPNSLSITIENGAFVGTPFLASVDTVAMTVSIAPGTDAGDIYDYGPTTMYLGDYVSIDEGATIIGTIEADGTINIDKLTMILADYGMVDGLWDAFNTTWTKSEKKAASGGAGYAAKAARF